MESKKRPKRLGKGKGVVLSVVFLLSPAVFIDKLCL